MKSRKIGVLTLGVALVTFGVLFLLRVFLPWFDYIRVIQFWPVILILIGLEVLITALVPQKEGVPRPQVDVLSILALFGTLLLACGLAAAQFVLEQVPQLVEHMTNWLV